jgi:hypothetical protein
MFVVMVTTLVMVMIAATVLLRPGLFAAPLPAREQHEEKSGGKDESDDDERIHNGSVTTRTVGPGRHLVECAPGLPWDYAFGK